MANDFLTLLQITERKGTDAAVGLVEEVTTYAPEVNRIMGRPIPGISYKARVRTAFTSKGAFRNSNEGMEVGSSKYQQKRFDCFYFDSQLQVDEQDLEAATSEGDSPDSVLADEASGGLQAKMIQFGQQFYKGTAIDKKGFPGLIDFLDASMVIDAGGAGGATERVWFVWMDLKGVHLLFGKNSGLTINQWARQQVKDANNNAFFAQVNNIAGFIGLSCAHKFAVGCIKNVTAAKPLTDALGAQMLAKFPIGIQPNLCFATRNSRALLQQSRTVTIFANQGAATAKTPGTTGNVASLPTDIQGVPLEATDSILTEAAS